MGMLRDKAIKDCPEEFESRLREFFDVIEGRVTDIKDELNINSIDEIHNLKAAYDMAVQLADDLY